MARRNQANPFSEIRNIPLAERSIQPPSGSSSRWDGRVRLLQEDSRLSGRLPNTPQGRAEANAIRKALEFRYAQTRDYIDRNQRGKANPQQRAILSDLNREAFNLRQQNPREGTDLSVSARAVELARDYRTEEYNDDGAGEAQR